MACEPESDYFNKPTYAAEGENFDGLIIQKKPSGATRMCPKCKGHGRWNHQLDVYKFYQDGRHPHSTHICRDCNGSGWLFELHEHKWVLVAHLSKNYNEYKCYICGRTERIDTGD